MADLINHKELAESRLVTQFKESVNLISYLKALLVEADNLEQVFQDLLNKRWIDTAEGVQLDIIGAIVSQPRLLIDADIIYYFGFSPYIAAQSFGTVKDPSVGGRFRSKYEVTIGTRSLTDDEYRLYIRARIVKNIITPTLPAMLSFLNFIFQEEIITITDGAMSYIVYFSRKLSYNEKILLLETDLVPKVAAVGVLYQD